MKVDGNQGLLFDSRYKKHLKFSSPYSRVMLAIQTQNMQERSEPNMIMSWQLLYDFKVNFSISKMSLSVTYHLICDYDMPRAQNNFFLKLWLISIIVLHGKKLDRK